MASIRFEDTSSEYIATTFAALARELRQEDEFLRRLADEVLAEQAKESLERARQIPLAPATEERRQRRNRTPWHQGGPPGSPPLPQSPMAYGIVTALTISMRYERHFPVALRHIGGAELLFGAAKWVSGYIGYHMELVAGPTRHMPARLDFMTGASRDEIERQTVALWSDYLYLALEKAGAPLDWLAAAESPEFGF